MRHPRPVHLARSRAQRWGLWIVLALLVLATVVVCQAALSASPAPVDSAHVVAGACDKDLGHDVLCVRGIAAAIATSTRSGRDDAAGDELGPLVALVLVGAVIVATAGAGGGIAASWAAQQLVPGRRRLAAIGISRI